MTIKHLYPYKMKVINKINLANAYFDLSVAAKKVPSLMVGGGG